MTERKKYGRHKPGWGRKFSETCRYKDDPIYWKLYDLTVLRNPRAVFEIKEPHRFAKRTNLGEQNDDDNEEGSREEV